MEGRIEVKNEVKKEIRAVRGMKDLFGDSFEAYRHIVQKSIEVGRKHGYQIVHTPILEHTEVFQRTIGDETDVVSKEMYSFVDKGGDSLTLRPEGTAGVARAVVSEKMGQNLPLKLMYYGEMFRYDRPQKGRLRQFHQIGFENIGTKTPYADALAVVLASEILQKCGIFDFKILLNTLGDEETRGNYVNALVKFFSRYENKLSAESQTRLRKNPLRILDSKDHGDREICAMAPMISDYLSKEAGHYFEKVCSLLSCYGVGYEIDHFLVRGLDYYSHTAFEIKSTSDEQNAIGGGGRYDKLLGMLGGPDVSGIGFALGVERLLPLLPILSHWRSKTIKAAVVPLAEKQNDAAFDVLKLLYQHEIPAEFVSTGNVSKKMKIANRLSCDFCVILGEDEVRNQTVTVKFMNQNAEQKILPVNDLINFLICQINSIG